MYFHVFLLKAAVGVCDFEDWKERPMLGFHHMSQTIICLGVLCACGFSLASCNKEPDLGEYYIVLTVRDGVKNCYMKKPLVDKRYEGKMEIDKTRDGREKTAWCDVELPKELNKQYKVCVLNGVSVGGLDVDNKNSIHRWKCDVSKTTSSISISMNISATSAEVLCTMVCI